jgi:hypothetical protein
MIILAHHCRCCGYEQQHTKFVIHQLMLLLLLLLPPDRELSTIIRKYLSASV